jgi:YbbR domain-containing protein
MINVLRHLVLKDFWLKLFSLALAVMLWILVNLMQSSNASPRALNLAPVPTSELVFSNQPVAILTSAEHGGHFTVFPETVTVTVKGEDRLMRNLQRKDIRVVVDLTGVESTKDSLMQVEVTAPSGVVSKANPEQVRVSSLD